MTSRSFRLSLLPACALAAGLSAQIPSPLELNAFETGAFDPVLGSATSGAAADGQLGRAVSLGGDVNGDGYEDLFLGAPYASDSLFQAGVAYVLFGRPGFELPNLASLDGTLGFRLEINAVQVRLGWQVTSLGDFNGDGYDDLAVSAPMGDMALGDEGFVYVVFGRSDLGAGGHLDVASLDGTNGFVLHGVDGGEWAGQSLERVGDVDGDGYADLLAGAPNAGHLPPSYAVASACEDVAVGDMNGDQIPDYVISKGDWDKVSILYAGAGGSVTAELEFPVQQDPRRVTLSDLNLDGDLDVVAEARFSTGSPTTFVGRVAVLPNLGFGLLGLQQNYHLAYKGVKLDVGDLNHDGYPDIAAAHSDNSADPLPQGRLALLMNTGTGAFTVGPDLLIGYKATGVAIGRFNADTHMDVVLQSSVHPGLQHELRLFFGNGLGGLTAGPTVESDELEGLKAFDFNGDGLDDVLALLGATIFLNQGDGSLAQFADYYTNANVVDAEYADVTGDGKEDILLVDGHSSPGHVQVLPGVGDGSFQPWTQVYSGGWPMGLACVDFDHDGDLDVVAAHELSKSVAFLANNGDGTFPSERTGAAYLVYGGAAVGASGAVELSSLDGTSGVRFLGRAGDDVAGTAVASAGDWNADGAPDVAIGAPFASGKVVGGGEVFLYHGGGSVGSAAEVVLGNMAPLGGARFFGGTGSDSAGWQIDGGGDFDADGFDDLLIGGPYSKVGVSELGRIWLVRGGLDLGESAPFDLNDLDGTNGFELVGMSHEDWTGYSAVFAGDVNGTGADSILLGAPKTTAQNFGAAFLIYGGTGAGDSGSLSLADIDETNGVHFLGALAGEELGLSVAGGADIDGDGFSDMLLGARLHNLPSPFSGRVYLMHGIDAYLQGAPDTVSLFLGNPQSLTLRAGPLHAGDLYAIAGSLSGTTPGFALGSLHIPLNLDAYFFLSVGPATPLVGGIGFLGAHGEATASFDLPFGVNPALAGLSVHHAFVTLDLATGAIQVASNAVKATFVP